jgi:hypothetical protein
MHSSKFKLRAERDANGAHFRLAFGRAPVFALVWLAVKEAAGE